MQKIATIIDLNKFPGAHHVSNQGPAAPDWYVAYGPAQGGCHPDIAVLRSIGGGKYLVEAETSVIAKLGTVEDVQAFVDAGKWPIYETQLAEPDRITTAEAKAEHEKASADLLEQGAITKPLEPLPDRIPQPPRIVIGAKAVVDGKIILSTKPTIDSALGKLTKLDYTTVKGKLITPE